jgi:lysophospholipid acyltransferase (LPLAT)-like uncharacterized protein
MSFKTIYKMAQVPYRWFPFYYTYGYGVAFILWVYYLLVRRTSRAEWIGLEKTKDLPSAIYLIWHYQWHAYFSLFHKHQRHAWLNHPYWYMKPVELMVSWVGVKKQIYGSAGNDGKTAASELMGYLKDGYSTVIAPDGPAGPPRVLKKGTLLLALDAGVPLIPIRITYDRFILQKSWDRKEVVLPFSKFKVYVGDPVQVTHQNMEQASALISSFLNGASATSSSPHQNAE